MFSRSMSSTNFKGSYFMCRTYIYIIACVCVCVCNVEVCNIRVNLHKSRKNKKNVSTFQKFKKNKKKGFFFFSLK